MKGSERALEGFKKLASGEAVWYMLLCRGKAGCGKTHLCQALVSGLSGRIWEWNEVVTALKEAMHDEYRGKHDDRLRAFKQAKYLVLDDVGMGTTGSVWEMGVLDEIINYRYREELLTVVTTNLDLKELPERVVSRFRDAVTSRVVVIEADDYRPKKGQK